MLLLSHEYIQMDFMDAGLNLELDDASKRSDQLYFTGCQIYVLFVTQTVKGWNVVLCADVCVVVIYRKLVVFVLCW